MPVKKKPKKPQKIKYSKPKKVPKIKKKAKPIFKTIKKKPIIKKQIKKIKKIETPVKKVKVEREKPPIKYLKISEEKAKEFISEIIGEDAVPVIDVLLKKNNISEFNIADKLNISINHFRNIIYRLDCYSLMTSIRKKDKVKGWYIYYWTLKPFKLEDLYWEHKRKKLEKLKNKLKEEESNYFYMCPNKCERLDLQRAMEAEFRCKECGKLLVQDKCIGIASLRKEIIELENLLKESNKSS